jgi:hypothetical protein
MQVIVAQPEIYVTATGTTGYTPHAHALKLDYAL